MLSNDLIKKINNLDLLIFKPEELLYLVCNTERAFFSSHYENTPMKYTAIFHCCKKDNFQLKLFDFVHIFAQNIYCGYTIEPPH